MSYPKYSGHGRIERNKLVSKKISILSSENDNLPKNKKKLLTVPFGEDPYFIVASHFQSDDGVEIYKLLQRRLKKDK